MADQTEATRRKERYWAAHLERWRRGGRSQREYCAQHGLSVSTLQLWRRRLAATRVDPCVEIVPVVKTSRPGGLLGPQALTLVVGGRYRVEIGDGVQVETLRVVLDALETR